MAKGSTYIFLGPEIGEKEEAIQEIRRKLQGSRRAVEEMSFYAGETTVPGIVSILRNGSLFADARLFLIKNAEVLKKKEETESIAAYIKTPQDDTVLILISENTVIDKVIENAAGAAGKKLFYELFENRKIEWVATFFSRQGCRISEDGITAILEMVENNTEALRRECSRLILFLGKEKVIEAEDVEKWLSHTREESAFTLFSRIASGDFSKSLESMRTLLAAKETPIAIFGGLASCFRKLRSYAHLLEEGRGYDDFELKKIGLGHPKSRQDYTQARRRYDADACLALIAEYDFKIRSTGSALEALTMDIFLYKLMYSAKPRQ
ncbi:MAG: DNA polymerase III subunit delta [Treponema sp.]|jgi:DNA polymerase-3 subunit delta|nr:DNA polymerase III subunit delta [Treponema sp.]